MKRLAKALEKRFNCPVVKNLEHIRLYRWMLANNTQEKNSESQYYRMLLYGFKTAFKERHNKPTLQIVRYNYGYGCANDNSC